MAIIFILLYVVYVAIVLQVENRRSSKEKEILKRLNENENQTA